MNVFENWKEDCVPFLSTKPKPKKERKKERRKERKKAFNCESTAEPASSGKGSFYNQDEWLREIEEHERTSDTGKKQSVEISSLAEAVLKFGWKPSRRRTFATSSVSAGNEMLAAAFAFLS